MASNKGDQPRKNGSMPSGVRGPGGPPPATPPAGSGSKGRSGGSGNSSSPFSPLGTPPTSTPGWRYSFEQRSYPILKRLHAMPRWIIVVAPAVFLFLGLILTGPTAWLGGIFLFLVWLFVAWLTALSWPALTVGSRIFRFLVVVALLGIVVLKFMGRF
jgi:hypothetical protein